VSIASYLKNKLPKLFIRILDERLLTSKQLEQELYEIKPDIVGISCIFKNYKDALDLARLAKKVGAKVLVGGHYASALAREILINRGPASVDYCVDGVIKQDGERAFYQYVRGDSMKKIDNLVYLEKDKIIENKISLLNLDKLPSLRVDLADPKIYFKKHQNKFPTSQYRKPFMIYSQKGCYWRSASSGGCVFCSIMYNKLRLKSPKIIWNEIEMLVSDYGVDYIWDISDNFLSDKEWFKEFYKEFFRRKIIKPFLKIQARADNLIDEKIIKMLSEINVVQIFVGFESNDNQCLNNIKKGTGAPINEKAISILAKYKISIMAYFVLGLPEETEQSLARTIKFAEKIFNIGNKNLLIIPRFVPLPGSAAFNFLVKKTGKKYVGADIINWDEASNDWTKHFCNVSSEKITKAQDYLRKLQH
ncbi:B12-binding domain-containing radical SAM protein, partial [Patescibacteria group bacterium]|nr:B12-binding domain-containing radical SAM protein [Patescibacteria group bacterium]